MARQAVPRGGAPRPIGRVAYRYRAGDIIEHMGAKLLVVRRLTVGDGGPGYELADPRAFDDHWRVAERAIKASRLIRRGKKG